MSVEIKIRYKPEFGNLFQYADRVHTIDGNEYFQIPFWIQKLPDGDFLLHSDTPEDLQQFITKAGLGGDNPQIKRAEL